MKLFPLISCTVIFLAGCTERPLTGTEAAFLGTVHGGNVDYDAVIIRKGGLADVRPNPGAVAVGNTIHYSNSLYRDNFVPEDDIVYIDDLMLLAHEVTHIWQYNSGVTPNCTVEALAQEHVDHGDDVYDYPKPLSRSRKFINYRCEQQAEIVADWVLLRATQNPEARAYEKIIRAAMPLDKLFSGKVLNRRAPSPVGKAR